MRRSSRSSDRKKNEMNPRMMTASYVGSTSMNASTVMLVDVNAEKAAAEASDVAHVTPFAGPVRVRSGGMQDLEGAAVVVLTGSQLRIGRARSR